jgi:hypothetical protein
LELIKKNILDYPELFRYADNNVRDKLIELIDKEKFSGDSQGQIMASLAWIGDDAVIERYRGWKKKKPKWIDKISMDNCSTEAGWILTEKGEKRMLYYETSYK